MKPIEQHEQFEIEVLQFLNSKRLLKKLVFGGGTMLRLCHELNRYSVDLDFYFKTLISGDPIFDKMQQIISSKYEITDAKNKFNTIQFEFRSNIYPMRLKIEINKEKQHPISKQCIAFSRFSNLQVLIDTISLDHMMKNKTEALLSRKEIRDAFDIEFLVRKGIGLPAESDVRLKMKTVIQSFSKQEFNVKLGSLLPADSRDYYKEAGFSLLERHLSL